MTSTARHVSLALVLVLSSCPLPITVRCSTDGDCEGGERCRSGACAPLGAGGGGGSEDAGPSCAYDWQCPRAQNCDAGRCAPGPKIGDGCSWSLDCGAAYCSTSLNVCAHDCIDDGDCFAGYVCAPHDTSCVPRCEGRAASRLGATCVESVECGCGFCLPADGGGTRCHQPCERDEDCDAGLDGCRRVASSPKKVCPLP